MQHVDEQDRANGTNLSEEYGCFNPGNAPTEYYDIGLDLTGVSRKHISSEIDIVANELNDEEFRGMVRSLNRKQKEFFFHILHLNKISNAPVYEFLTGGAGVGKSLLLKACYQALLKYYSHKPGENPDEMKVLLCAPTGKAAYNIGGITIHAAFCIPAVQGFKYKPLDMQQLSSFQTKYKSLKVVFIDEISMVGKKCLIT